MENLVDVVNDVVKMMDDIVGVTERQGFEDNNTIFLENGMIVIINFKFSTPFAVYKEGEVLATFKSDYDLIEYLNNL